MRQLIRHKLFKKDLDKVTLTDQQFAKMIQYLSLLIEDNDLPIESKDHPLNGEWKNFREFHLGGDMLLIYHIDEDNKQIVLMRIGSHAQLFR
ncbi:MAG: type II toxin-antitoxin system YafQ family toxin [Sulfuricurvum sp.]|jgi:mRNA interferase YafQ|uniref:type II toxin-antitoxin system RelE/ParE family toxin n=1 Tax=Sulfuricurvum sp. TaxID=2025608 RepID=UPI0025FF7BED|nr:type II toxin-antitoxin system YafQ family toxin [Sulfuricurvum sp.]MCK9372079.1 type II toxin-antitoxin system YafQ family toxin [Sulfuricurvum sp.]